MQSGIVKWFDPAKGFGFVISADGGSDTYLHIKALQKAGLEAIEAGTSVTFSVANRGGKQFVQEIAIVDVAASRMMTQSKHSPKAQASAAALDEEEEFEREWGLRRA